MRKRLIIAAILIIAGILYANTIIIPIDKTGKRVDPGALHTDHSRWVVIDSTTTAEGNVDDLGVTERTYQIVRTLIDTAANDDDSMSIFDIPRGWNGIRIRAIGITNDGDQDYAIYAGTLGDGNRDADRTSADCELAYIGLFSFVIGTQASTTSTYEMADELIVTESDWTVDLTTGNKVTSPSGNRVAEARFDLLGADILVLVPIVVDANCKLLARGF